VQDKGELTLHGGAHGCFPSDGSSGAGWLPLPPTRKTISGITHDLKQDAPLSRRVFPGQRLRGAGRRSARPVTRRGAP
jgi:hypothetical protein